MDKKDKSLFKFRQAVYAISALLVVVLFIIVPAGFGMLHLGWATSIVSVLLLIVLLTLNLYSELPVRFLQRLKLDLFVPAFREVINHQKNLYQCRLVLRNMEYTLDFYRLWDLIELQPEENKTNPLEDQRSAFRRWWRRLIDAITWKRLHAWLLKDPLEKERTLPDAIAHRLVNGTSEQEQIQWCSEETARYLQQRLTSTIGSQADSPTASDSKPEGITDEQRVRDAITDHEWDLLLELLYQEHHGPDARTFWNEIKNKEFLAGDLAALLMRSGQLPAPESDLPLTTDDLPPLLLSMERFDRSELKAALSRRQEQRRLYRFVVDRMAYALEYFHLFEQMTGAQKSNTDAGASAEEIQPPYYKTDPTGKPGFAPQLRRKLIDEPAETTDGDYLPACVERVSVCFTDPASQVMAGILKLLYLELYGPVKAEQQIWLTQKKDPDFVSGLSAVLLRSGDLPDKEVEEPYSCEELSHLLNTLDIFSLERLKAKISDDQKKRFKTRFEISRLEHTLNFYNLFHLFEDRFVERADQHSPCRFKRHFQDNLVDHALQSIHQPGDPSWVDEFIQGLLTGVSQAKIEALFAENDRLELEPMSRNARAKDQAFLADPGTYTPTRGDFLTDLKTVLELLYREQHGQATNLLWDDALNNDRVLFGLAQLLIESRRLPAGDEDLSYDSSRLVSMMKELGTFDLDRTRALVLSDLERRRKNREVVEKMTSVLHYYNLYPVLQKEIHQTIQGRESFSNTFRRSLIDEPPEFHTEMDQVDDFAARLGQYMQPARLAGSFTDERQTGLEKSGSSQQALPTLDEGSLKDVFVFLYWKYHKGETRAHWQEMRQDDDSLHSLAGVMLHSDLLPKRDGYFPYSFADIEHILKQSDFFEVSQTEDQLENLNEIWQYAVGYHEFLLKNDISCPGPVSSDLLGQVRLPLTPRNITRAIQDFLLWQGREAILHQYEVLPDVRVKGRKEKQYLLEHVDLKSSDSAELVDCLSLISLIVFVTEKVTESLRLRERPCLMASRKEKALLITSAYLEFRKYLRIEDKIGEKDFVSIDYLARHWAENIAASQSKPIGYGDELETIQATLNDGRWPRRVREVLEKTLDNIGQKHQAFNQKLEELVAQSDLLRKVLEAAFRRLKTQTIERYLDARKQIAYLLTFRVESGTLATLLDTLVGKNEDDAKLRNKGAQIGVNFFLPNGKRKYNFVQFCPFARVGVVPTGMAFDEFFKEFQHDFDKVVDARDDLLSPADISHNLNLLNDIEVIMSRFGLAGQNYYSFKKKDIVHDKAIDKVRELLPYELEIKDMSQVIGYQEENILEFILQLPIKELVVCQMTLSEDEATVLESADAPLKKDLLKALGLLTVKDLAKACQAPAMGAEAMANLARLLEPVLIEAGDKRREKIAKAYMDTLAAIGELL